MKHSQLVTGILLLLVGIPFTGIAIFEATHDAVAAGIVGAVGLIDLYGAYDALSRWRCEQTKQG